MNAHEIRAELRRRAAADVRAEIERLGLPAADADLIARIVDGEALSGWPTARLEAAREAIQRWAEARERAR